MKEINDIFKDKLFNYEKTPPEDIFSCIKNNYPKTGFKDFCKTTIAKIIFSSVIVSIAVILTVLFVANKQNNDSVEIQSIEFKQYVVQPQLIQSKQAPTQTQYITSHNSEYQNIENLTENKNKNSENIIKIISFFEVRDTNVCGLEYNSKIGKNYFNIIVPNDLTLINNNDKVSFVASKSGKYTIKYKEIQNNITFVDSMTIVYNEFLKPELNLLNENICANQILIVKIDNPKNYKINWDIDYAKIKKITNNLYEISNLKDGKNNIKINYFIENCILSDTKTITVAEVPKYTINTKASYCSGANAEIFITTKNIKPEYFMIDNSQINKTGKFNNITAGIHDIQIKYGNGCILNDTVFVFDSLKLKPYFKSQAEPIDRNKYFFNNLTEIDFKGYEKNKDVEFTWKINDAEISNGDNLSYQFTNNGIYNVKLIAKINDICVREYSEKIEIANNNIKIPNLFTPNGDGIGDYFEIKSDSDFKEFSIIISGNNGETVFESHNSNNSWDGKIYGNNDAPEGLYYYSIFAIDGNGNQINKNGYVQLIRR